MKKGRCIRRTNEFMGKQPQERNYWKVKWIMDPTLTIINLVGRSVVGLLHQTTNSVNQASWGHLGRFVGLLQLRLLCPHIHYIYLSNSLFNSIDHCIWIFYFISGVRKFLFHYKKKLILHRNKPLDKLSVSIVDFIYI